MPHFSSKVLEGVFPIGGVDRALPRPVEFREQIVGLCLSGRNQLIERLKKT